MARKSPQRLRMEEQRKKLIESITPLVALPEFEKFIGEVRQMKDYTVEYLIHSQTLASEKETGAAAGEVRAYLWFLQTYEAHKEALMAQVEAQAANQAHD